MVRLDELPNDPALLKRQWAQERAELIAQHEKQLDRVKEKAADRIAEQTERIRDEAAEQLESLRLRMEAEKKAAVEAILRRIYGPRSERFDARQLLLFGQRVEELPLDESSVVDESGQELTTRCEGGVEIGQRLVGFVLGLPTHRTMVVEKRRRRRRLLDQPGVVGDGLVVLLDRSVNVAAHEIDREEIGGKLQHFAKVGDRTFELVEAYVSSGASLIRLTVNRLEGRGSFERLNQVGKVGDRFLIAVRFQAEIAACVNGSDRTGIGPNQSAVVGDRGFVLLRLSVRICSIEQIGRVKRI